MSLPADPAARYVEFAPGKRAHASGALWLPGSAAVLVADAHLGYAWAQRRRGQLGPLVEGGGRDRLIALLDELHPAILVFLGDLVHAPKPAPEERSLIEQTIRDLATRARIIAVRGNHDRGLLRDFGHLPMEFTPSWSTESVFAIHGDRPAPIPENAFLVAGHFHPSLSIRDAAGAGQRVSVFALTKTTCILPAFSPFAAGHDLRRGLPAEARTLLGPGPVHLIAATGRRALRLPHAINV